MNPKQFLLWGGLVLVLVGVLGMGLGLGPTVDDSWFGASWWFDTAENWAHLVLGIVALFAAFLLPSSTHKPLVLLVGLAALLFGLYSLTGEKMVWGANLENPSDTVLHLAVGLWALWAGLRKTEVSAI